MSDRIVHHCDHWDVSKHVCCSSCHEDVEYGYELVELDLKDGSMAIVCCAMSTYLREEGLVKEYGS